MPPVDLTNELEHEDGADNTAGVAQYAYYGKMRDVETFPTPVLDNSAGDGTLEQLVTISDNIVMKPGKGLMKVYMTIESGGITDELQGEFDGKSYLTKFVFFHPGTGAKALGFRQYVKNGDGFWIVPEQDGQRRLIGHPAYPAKLVTNSGGTGIATADRKGSTFEFQCVRKGPAPILTGRVEVSGVGSGFDADQDGYQEILFID